MGRQPLTILLPVLLVAGAAVAAQAPPEDARTWIGRAAEIESWMRSVPMLKFDDLSVGVTRPKRAHLPPGGPMTYLVWKVIPPGRYAGAWESYQSEIAAYELDKLLGLNMVPPTVEKVYRGERGAAVMWVAPSKSFKDMGATPATGAPTPPPALAGAWSRQLVRAKMFHNLVNNIDPNLGNWLVDPAWNLMLIDCSRCFTSGRTPPHALTRVDPELWARMQALTEPGLSAVLGGLMGRGEVRAIIQRRDRMQVLIDAAIKERGEAWVFMKDVGR
jgi:hypothetical protein